MKLPITWLKEYVDFDDTTQGLADKLTFSGVEVEAVETIGLRASGVVAAEVRAVNPHPNADRLTVCSVFDGEAEHEVVCGAPNVRAGMKAAFAPVGATLADGTRLKKAKLRGVASAGMLCADDELGLSDDHEGLLVLDDETVPGAPLEDVLGPPEVVLDLEVTPNRPDCLSIIGLAREVAALYGTTLRLPDVSLQETGAPVSELTSVDVQDGAACPRYTARVIRGVQVGPSPTWMQHRLTLSGLRPINNLVDITNYVLLECGHPLHAFDQSLLDEGRIVVRRARAGETLTTLDESAHELDAEVLVIADAQRPVAVAGIMGGVGSEIRDATDTVLLESAYFFPPLIRATSRRMELRSDSSYRFERGTDIENVAWASRRAAALMAAYAGGQVAPGMVDVYPSPAAPVEITFRWEQVRRMIGVPIPNETIRAILTALELEVLKADEESGTVRVPSFRGDLTREVDLVEEVARMHGLDQIPTPAPRGRLVPGADDSHYLAMEELRTHLVGLGLRELVHYSLVSDEVIDRFAPGDTAERVRLPNPVSQDQSVLRTHLVPQLVETLGRNHARQCGQMAAFELGKVFRSRGDGRVEEEEHLGIALLGPVGVWGPHAERAADTDEIFLWLKGLWEALATAQGMDPPPLAACDTPYLLPSHAAALGTLGVLGLVKPEVTATWRLAGQPVAVLEVALAPLLNGYRRPRTVKPLAAFPAVGRDVAFVTDESVQHAQIVDVMRAAAPPELETIRLFDIFRGKSVGPRRKSLAYALTYRSTERTLTDEDANAYHDRVKAALTKQLGVEIREN